MEIVLDPDLGPSCLQRLSAEGKSEMALLNRTFHT